MSRAFNRRQFLEHTVSGAGAVLGTGYFVNPAVAWRPPAPNERLNIASVGTRRRAGANLAAVSSENIVALADVDARALEEVAPRFPQARQYRDFRVMLEKEGDNLDAVLVSTPDHIHAPATAMALRMNKHVYCEKPLTHTVFEARTVREVDPAEQAGHTDGHADPRRGQLPASGRVDSVWRHRACSRRACLVGGQLLGSSVYHWHAGSRLPGLGPVPGARAAASLQSGNTSRTMAQLLGFWHGSTGRFRLPLHGPALLGARPAMPDGGLGTIKNGGSTTCNFDYSGALTEAVLLGVVSYRSGEELAWDGENLKITNSPDAQAWIHKEYRQGWTL